MTCRSRSRFFLAKHQEFVLQVVYDVHELKLRLQDTTTKQEFVRNYTDADLDVRQDIHKKIKSLDQIMTVFEELAQSNQNKINPLPINYGEIVYHRDTPIYSVEKRGIVKVFVPSLKPTFKQPEFSYLKLHKVQAWALDEDEKHLQKRTVRRVMRQKDQSNNENEEIRNSLEDLQAETNAKLEKMRRIISQQVQRRVQQQVAQKLQVILTRMNINMQPSISVDPCSLRAVCGLPTPNISRFQIQIPTNTITYIGPNKRLTNYIFNQPIDYQSDFSFKIKLVNTQKNMVMIGIIDYEKQRNQESSYQSSDVVSYSGGSKFLWPRAGPVGVGFYMSETVQVDVQLKNRYIKWSVGGITRAQYQDQTDSLLGDSSRKFYPYIEMSNTSDSVQWII